MFKTLGDLLSKFKQNLPELAFLLFVSKFVILGASFGEALALMALVGYLGYAQFLQKTKIEEKQALMDEMQKLRDEMQTMSKSMQENFLLRSEAEQLKTDLASLKIDKIIPRGVQNNEQKATTKRFF